MLKAFIGPIKKRIGEFDYIAFEENPNSIAIDDEDGSQIMDECKERQLISLKNSKNASKGALLAEYVTTIPSAYSDLIKLIKG